jgi:hypothetical protein
LLARASCHFNSLSFVQSSSSLPLVTSTTVFVGSPMPLVSAPSSGSTTRTTGVQERATSLLPTSMPTTRPSFPALKTVLSPPYASSLSCSLHSSDAPRSGWYDHADARAQQLHHVRGHEVLQPAQVSVCVPRAHGRRLKPIEAICGDWLFLAQL